LEHLSCLKLALRYRQVAGLNCITDEALGFHQVKQAFRPTPKQSTQAYSNNLVLRRDEMCGMLHASKRYKGLGVSLLKEDVLVYLKYFCLCISCDYVFLLFINLKNRQKANMR
jgi:hypothetical protein